ncbi:MAG: hypothetical protein K6L81_07290 [Agarilytica sp.]
MSKKIASFELNIYAGAGENSEPVYSCSGLGDEWLQYMQVRLPGFDGTMLLRLEGFWRTVAEEMPSRYSEQITAYETIVKMGDTMQLKSIFNAIATIFYFED